MDSYTPLLEKTRLPQPSLQKFAVTSIFSKLRTAPTHLDSDSGPGREAIYRCLQSTSPAVVDQSVRELCRLVVDSKMDFSRGLLELQSALEGSDPKFTTVFVKGIGFLVRFGFRESNGKWRLGGTENHPFVKILLCRTEVQDELVQQVLLFVLQNKHLGMGEVCTFLRPFLIYSVLGIPHSDPSAGLFVRNLLTSVTALCCSLPHEAISMLKLLMDCIKYFPNKNVNDLRDLREFANHMVHAYVAVVKHHIGSRLLITETQLFGLQLLETVLDVFLLEQSGWIEPIIEISTSLLVVQKDLGLPYIPEISSLILSLFSILSQSDLEHEQISVLKLLVHLLKWKSQTEQRDGGSSCSLSEEILLLFPVVNLTSWPSKCIKEVAGELIILLEENLGKLLMEPKKNVARVEEYSSVKSPGKVAFRLLQYMWFQVRPQRFFIEVFASSETFKLKGGQVPMEAWALSLREHLSWIMNRRKSSLKVSQAQEKFVVEMPILICAIAGVLVLHQSMGAAAVDVLGAMGIMEPKIGVPLLLLILFLNSLFSQEDVGQSKMTLKVLGMLPLLSSHSSMVPLIVQAILPLLHQDAKPVLYATAARLLCQTWQINDRAFGSLEGILHPSRFADTSRERSICLSLAASIRDVCRKNPDRGVDLILSVSACVESKDSLIQALGFQSLAHLCEADVIDFYTAWDVIEKYMQDYAQDPALAHRWGAIDAEAYPEASRSVSQLLWSIGASTDTGKGLMWSKARASAFYALAHYEISYIEKIIPEFKEKISSLLFRETDDNVLEAMEKLLVKVILHEHTNRRRLMKEKRVMTNKIEKLLDVFPQIIFSSGKNTHARNLPEAALMCFSFIPKDVKGQGPSTDLHSRFENALVEIAHSLQLARNTFLAIISLQSWKSFMHHWIRATKLSPTANVTSLGSDKTFKAANDILKIMIRIADESIPRIGENIALAIGALCAVLPPSVHTVKAAASRFLLSWLFQSEHEHRQWSAALSLGLISKSLHVTDHKQKFQNINGLLEVLCSSRSTFVKGACGVGLGFACQSLLTGVASTDDANKDREFYRMEEADLLGMIIRYLSLTVCQLTNSSSETLQSLSEYFPEGMRGRSRKMNSGSSNEHSDVLEEDLWGLAGLVLGLGSTISALYRTGDHDVVLNIKNLIVSWLPHVNPFGQDSDSCSERSEILLSVGSCLAVPMVAAFCQRVEMMDDSELDNLIDVYRRLISDLVSVNASGTFFQSLLMAACSGAGSLLACILNEGVHTIEVGCVKGMLELFRNCYSTANPTIIRLGGMLGVVNSLGAEAGSLFRIPSFSSSVQTGYLQKDSSHISGPLLTNPACEPLLTSLVQEISVLAQNSDDHQLQRYAAWVLSLLRCRLWSSGTLEVNESLGTNHASLQVSSHTLTGDTVLMKLCTWLANLDLSKTDRHAEFGTLRTILKCLSVAPRLPHLDWGAIVRRCMRYEAQSLPPKPIKSILRQEALQFALAQASHFDQLLSFLDELYDLARFRILELNLQSCMLLHLAELAKIFSGSRLEKLFNDIAEFLLSLGTYGVSQSDVEKLICVSCWNGLYQCLEQASLDSLEYLSGIERCMEVLFYLLPASQVATVVEADYAYYIEVWCAAIKCLERASHAWLLNFLQVDFVHEDVELTESMKKIEAKVRLVKSGAIPFTELGRLKAPILNSRSSAVWNVLIEIVRALQHAEGSVKRQWLIDAIEISCVSKNPSTAMQFVGLLSGSCCMYMPLLILDQSSVLNHLPVTLASLLTEPSWEIVVEHLASTLLKSTERICNWATRTSHSEDVAGLQSIDESENCFDESENSLAPFLLHVMHDTCVSLKTYLPLELQIRLANMVVP